MNSTLPFLAGMIAGAIGACIVIVALVWIAVTLADKRDNETPGTDE